LQNSAKSIKILLTKIHYFIGKYSLAYISSQYLVTLICTSIK